MALMRWCVGCLVRNTDVRHTYSPASSPLTFNRLISCWGPVGPLLTCMPLPPSHTQSIISLWLMRAQLLYIQIQLSANTDTGSGFLGMLYCWCGGPTWILFSLFINMLLPWFVACQSPAVIHLYCHSALHWVTSHNYSLSVPVQVWSQLDLFTPEDKGLFFMSECD